MNFPDAVLFFKTSPLPSSTAPAPPGRLIAPYHAATRIAPPALIKSWASLHDTFIVRTIALTDGKTAQITENAGAVLQDYEDRISNLTKILNELS